jgi:hypothetical protein
MEEQALAKISLQCSDMAQIWVILLRKLNQDVMHLTRNIQNPCKEYVRKSHEKVCVRDKISLFIVGLLNNISGFYNYKSLNDEVFI